MKYVVVIAAALLATPTAQAPDALGIEAFRTRLQTTEDVAWLEQVAASPDFHRTEWRKSVSRVSPVKWHRVDAYARLGALATPESLEAIKRVESMVRGRRLLADGIESGEAWISPTPTAADVLLQPAASAIVGYRSYAALIAEAYGPFAPFVMWQDPGDGRRWSRPYLAAPPVAGSSAFDAALSQRPKGVFVTFLVKPSLPPATSVPASIRIDLDAVMRDTDKDGWTDLEERQLGLNPTNVDSDADGLRDDIDGSPLYAPKKGDGDEETQLIQRALFAMYGLLASRWAVFVAPGSRPVQVHGHAGPMLFGTTRGGAQTSWKVESHTADQAVVHVTSWSGSRSKGVTNITLKNVTGTWVVVSAVGTVQR